jgi:hypothetical protein
MLIPANVDHYEIWRELNFFERALYLYLSAKFIEGSNGVLLSVKDIINQFGMSKHTIISAVKTLEGADMIEIEHTYRDNRYIVHPCWTKLDDKSYGENKLFIEQLKKFKKEQKEKKDKGLLAKGICYPESVNNQ